MGIPERILNKNIRLREEQIKKAEAGQPSSDKSIAQLKYELEMMANELMERSMNKVSDTTETQEKSYEKVREEETQENSSS